MTKASTIENRRILVDDYGIDAAEVAAMSDADIVAEFADDDACAEEFVIAADGNDEHRHWTGGGNRRSW